MIADKYLSYNNKIKIAVLCSGLWIYFRNSDCYAMIPRQTILPVIFVRIWTDLNYYEPLFLPLGLMCLVIYSQIRKQHK